MSVIAQQLLTLREARLEGLEKTMFEGRSIPLKEHHVVVTMNPGYLGRTELPDNLKVCVLCLFGWLVRMSASRLAFASASGCMGCGMWDVNSLVRLPSLASPPPCPSPQIIFRPVAMMIPDYSLIAEIMLFAEGFDTAMPLSRKMTRLYRLASEQLSQQKHYDYGLRAVKSVLVMAGALKRRNPTVRVLGSGGCCVVGVHLSWLLPLERCLRLCPSRMGPLGEH